MQIHAGNGTKKAASRSRTITASKGAADPSAREALADDNAEAKTAQERVVFYRERAAHLRVLLAQLKDVEARRVVKETIEDYEHLAVLVEEMKDRPTH